MIINDIDTRNVRNIHGVVYVPRALTIHPF